MILTREKFQKAKEKFISDGCIDDGTEEAQSSKLACLSMAETFIENWFMNYEESSDVDKEEFLDFAKTQIAVLITSGVAQKLDKEIIKAGNMMLTAFICVVYEMYFEEKKVVGTC